MSDESLALDEIRSIIQNNKMVFFIKGTPESPACGFTVKITNIAKTLGIEYTYIDVISKPNIRSAIKKFTDWPTIPQIFIDAQFIGGCDIFVEMYESGELNKMFNIA
ncbi:Grx4 family monothiol glutaredoxin [Candidatus Sarmatiella mevalonica]|uniref:Grx4 family monothiol glutaredoxin n=1 Tax=Candidatus Sarmatiella mevalonica TaxID=2770581 RepID=UPI00192104F3|nr:Grx4 family monothiol glutaredoxin [Candidatus Sarmatiella mevalonica]